MTISEFNALATDEAVKDLMSCCGSRRWAIQLATRRPYSSLEAVLRAADEAFLTLDPGDWLEAIQRVQDPVEMVSIRLRAGLPQSGTTARGAGRGREKALLAEFAAEAERYRKRHGFPFFECPAGKSAEELLASLRARAQNGKRQELQTAARELAVWARIRLGALLRDEIAPSAASSSGARP